MTSLYEVYEAVYGDGAGSIEEFTLLPIARDVMYTDGLLRFTLVFYKEDKEANMTMAIQVSDDVEEQIEELLGH
jgi:hypothetical protein